MQSCSAFFRIMQKAGKDLLPHKHCLKVVREYARINSVCPRSLPAFAFSIRICLIIQIAPSVLRFRILSVRTVAFVGMFIPAIGVCAQFGFDMQFAFVDNTVNSSCQKISVGFKRNVSHCSVFLNNICFHLPCFKFHRIQLNREPFQRGVNNYAVVCVFNILKLFKG